jgi:YegS/Rv2252/BmrU family lipid kinase
MPCLALHTYKSAPLAALKADSPRLRDAKNQTQDMRVCVIFNPVAKGDKARRFRKHLDDIARFATLKLTRGPGDAQLLAEEAVNEGFETIVAAGGDGTLNEVLNGIASSSGGPGRARLGVLPLGTVNVFARELRIPMKLDDAWKIILQGREAIIDLPCAEFGPAAAIRRRWFAQLAGAGFDARAIELVDWKLKKKIGPLAYVYAGLKAMGEHKPVLNVAASGVSCAGQLVLVGNGKLYGGNFKTFEQAQMDDGLLDVCVFPRVSVFTLLWCAGPLLCAGRLPSGAVRRFQSAEFTLAGPESSAFELDGELVGKLPVKFSTKRRQLRVIVP